MSKRSAVNIEDWADFGPGDRVMTTDGYPGTVTAIQTGPYPGTEAYDVTLDDGIGGGEYTASMLTLIARKSAAVQAEIEGRTADVDYPELYDILRERPSPELAYTASQYGYTDHPKVSSRTASVEEVSVQEVTDAVKAVHPNALAKGWDPMVGGVAYDYEVGGIALTVEWWDADAAEPEHADAFADEPWYASTPGTRGSGGTGATIEEAVRNLGPITAELKDIPEPALPETTSDDEGIQTEADYGLIDRIIDSGPVSNFLQNDLGPRLPGAKEGDWCRFRREDNCHFPKELDKEGTKQAGYAVYTPFDRGRCPRLDWVAQASCFSGDTEFLTYNGVRVFKEVVGTTQKVLDGGGQWVDAEILAFGNQALYKVVLERKGEIKEILATADHRWLTQGRKRSEKAGYSARALERVTYLSVDPADRVVIPHRITEADVSGRVGTCSVCGPGASLKPIYNGFGNWRCKQAIKDSNARRARRNEAARRGLRVGDRLAWQLPHPHLHRWVPSPFGIAHGLVYGDGSRNGNDETLRGNDTKIDLYGEKNEQFLSIFQGHQTTSIDVEDNPDRQVGGTRVVGLPRFFKDRPSLAESAEYLFGWMVGFFAADGSVDRNGVVSLELASRDDLEFVQAVCNRLTIATYGIRTAMRPGCYGRGIIHEANMRRHGRCDMEVLSPIHRLIFVASTLTPEFFLVGDHRHRFEGRKGGAEPLAWRVKAVEPTDRIEEVFCAVVPTTASFVLTSNILTGNCPVGEPGPESGHPEAKPDGTRPYPQGQRIVAKTAFAPPPRSGPQPQWWVNHLREKIEQTEGFSFSHVLRMPPSGYMVSIYQEHERVIPMADIQDDASTIGAYINDKASVLGHPDNYLGAWLDGPLLYLDVSRHSPSLEEAMSLARQHNQLAIFDLSTFTEIRVEPAMVLASKLRREGALEPMVEALVVESAWRDLMDKAKRIRADGHVRIISINPPYYVAEVKGDTNTYQSMLMRVPGTRQESMWECGCKWSAYAWARSGRWKRYEGRKCSHVLALAWELQSREARGEMFEDDKDPTWRPDEVTMKADVPPPGAWRVQ